MIELECPNCARMGSVPNDKAHSRMVCKKCHMVFHMTPTGRTMLGEPPVPGKEKDKKHASDPGHGAGTAAAAKQRDWAEGLFEISRVCRLDRPRWWVVAAEGGLARYGLDPQEDALRSGDLGAA
ncbi:MAG: hypothetical protein LC745_03615, partial [Planctomycetia bacterium]|nr:hypothetical protein [Planctomycetia bacterium]